MAPYLRFPGSGELNQRFWGLRARNPTCGFISWEKGVSIFTWFNMIYGAFNGIACALVFIVHLSISISPPSKEDKDSLNISSIKGGNQSDVEYADEFEKLYSSKRDAVLFQFVMLVFCLFFSLWWFLSWKLNNAAVARELPKLKKYYVLTLLLLSVELAILLLTTEVIWAKAFFADVFVIMLEIQGIVFTHGYIASLSSSPGTDMGGVQPPSESNGIQCNP